MLFSGISIKVGKRRIRNTTKVLYGLGAFGYGSVGQTMGSFLMFFGTGILGIPGVLMGLAVGLSTVWDATTDPFVGHLSDNTKSRFFGKRHGWLLVGCVAVAAVNLMIWSISPAWSTPVKFSVLLVLLLVFETFCTVYSTPYGALGLDLSGSYDERTAVQGFKTAFSFAALLVPSLLMTVFLVPSRYVTMSASGGGYQDIAIFTSILCVVCGLVCCVGTYKNRPLPSVTTGACTPPQVASQNLSPAQHSPPADARPRKSEKNSFGKILSEFFAIFKQKNVARLIVGYAVSLSAGAFLTSLGMHVFTYTFQFSTLEIPIIMICLIGGIVAGQPVWFYVSRKKDKITALLAALVTILVGMAIFSAVFCFRGMFADGVLLMLIAATIFMCGIGTGCLYSLPISMFADCVYLNQQKTGADNTAKASGFLTFCTKISNAFIMFVIGLCLDLVGFRGGAPVQSISTQNWLGWLLIAGVVAASVTAMLIYGKYSYSKKDFN